MSNNRRFIQLNLQTIKITHFQFKHHQRKKAISTFSTNSNTEPCDNLNNKSLNIKLKGPQYKNNINFQIHKDTYKYIINHSKIPNLLLKLREETSKNEDSFFQMPIDQGPFISMLINFLNAKNVIEIGTYTGYSSIVLAQNLPKDGKVITIDKSDEKLDIAEKYWNEAGVRDKIQFLKGDATEILKKIINDGKENFFDLGFIDGPKLQYEEHYELMLKLIKSGGAILFDDILMDGQVMDENLIAKNVVNENLDAIKKINDKLHNDDRIEYYILNMGDGLGLCRKF